MIKWCCIYSRRFFRFLFIRSTRFLRILLTCARWNRRKYIWFIVTTLHSCTSYEQESAQDNEKKMYWMWKNGISSHANRNLKRFMLENITSRILKNEKRFTHGAKHVHTQLHKLCECNKAMEFFNLYSQSQIQSVARHTELRFLLFFLFFFLFFSPCNARCERFCAFYFILKVIIFNVDLQYKLLREWAWMAFNLYFMLFCVILWTQSHDTMGSCQLIDNSGFKNVGHGSPVQLLARTLAATATAAEKTHQRSLLMNVDVDIYV